jgi:NADH-quinone oxidoreductase subunit F
MSNFEKRRSEARKKWDTLKNSKIPVIFLGNATCGRAAGAQNVLDTVQQTLKEHRLKAKIVQVGCIGPCYLEPLLDVKVPGGPRVSFANVTPAKAKRIITSYLKDGTPPAEYAVGHFGDGELALTNGIPRLFDLPMLKPQVRIVLRNCGYIDP